MTHARIDPHLQLVRQVVPRTPQGCEECLQTGSPWVHLRLCLTCGHVGCCDSSPHRHFPGSCPSSSPGHPSARALAEAHDAAARVAELGDDGTNDLLVSNLIRTGEMEA